MLKLFTYSKLFQKKLKIDLIDYQEKYITNKLQFKFENYLTYNFNYIKNKDEPSKNLNKFFQFIYIILIVGI